MYNENILTIEIDIEISFVKMTEKCIIETILIKNMRSQRNDTSLHLSNHCYIVWQKPFARHNRSLPGQH